MNYEYNGNLLEEDRINLVVDDIINCYPQININQARQIAMLEGRISTDKNIEIEFIRIYNIMLVMNNDKCFLSEIYPNILNVLKKYSRDKRFDYYYNIAFEISNYIFGKGEFPLLNEF